MAYNYYLLFKTAQAEFRAWEKINPAYKRLPVPIIELTRGRKNSKAVKSVDDADIPTTLGMYNFDKTVDRVQSEFSSSPRVILDLTREDSLGCAEIDQLATSDNGYERWRNFLLSVKDSFIDLVPTVICNPSQGEDANTYKQNIRTQTEHILEHFTAAAYRASIEDVEFIYDLELIRDQVNGAIERGKHFIVIIDHEFIRPSTGIFHAARTVNIVDRVHSIIPRAEVVIMSTSFPKSISEIGNENHDVFPIEEIFLFEQVVKNCAVDISLNYGDYGSINPIRNDIVARGGWRPRIDFPTANNRTFYYREKRKKLWKDSRGKQIYTSYASHYISVAKKVRSDAAFDRLKQSWGVDQIELAANDKPPGASPSFWISVRMEIHILRQLYRLGLA